MNPVRLLIARTPFVVLPTHDGGNHRFPSGTLPTSISQAGPDSAPRCHMVIGVPNPGGTGLEVMHYPDIALPASQIETLFRDAMELVTAQVAIHPDSIMVSH